jgi:translation initiation factor IF-1
MAEKDENNLETGTILEALPNAQFRVELNDKRVVLAYLSGKMRLHHIKVLVGDTVSVKLDDYGERGRIVKRF